MNNSFKDILKNSLLAVAGLFLFGFGVHLTIQANIGAAPWDAFALGLSSTIGIKYGTASVIISLILIVVDILLREKIGIGMFLDAITVGKTVDLFDWLGWIPKQENIFSGILIMLGGLVIMGFAQYMYMKASLGCGPRDTLLVGLKRRTKKIPIGVISIMILAVVTFAGWLLGGPIGIGTIICAFLEGPVMQLDFRIVKFEPTEIKHQGIIESFRIIFKLNNKRSGE